MEEGGREGGKRELDKEERWGRGGREGPAGLSWPWGRKGVFIHPAPKHDGGREGGGREQPWISLSLSVSVVVVHPLPPSVCLPLSSSGTSLHLSLSASFSPVLTPSVTIKQDAQEDQTGTHITDQTTSRS